MIESFLAHDPGRETLSQEPDRSSGVRPTGQTRDLTVEEVRALAGYADLGLEWAARLDESSRIGRDLAEIAGRVAAMARRLEE